MNEELIKRCYRSVVKSSPLFMVKLEENKFKVTHEYVIMDEIFIDYIIAGFRIKCLGEGGIVKGWQPDKFGMAINSIIAKLYKDGQIITLDELIHINNKALDIFNEGEYEKYEIVNADAIRKYIIQPQGNYS